MSVLAEHRIDTVDRLARQRIANFYRKSGLPTDSPVAKYAMAVAHGVLYGSSPNGTPTASVRVLVRDVLSRALTEVYSSDRSSQIPADIRTRLSALCPSDK